MPTFGWGDHNYSAQMKAQRVKLEANRRAKWQAMKDSMIHKRSFPRSETPPSHTQRHREP